VPCCRSLAVFPSVQPPPVPADHLLSIPGFSVRCTWCVYITTGKSRVSWVCTQGRCIPWPSNSGAQHCCCCESPALLCSPLRVPPPQAHVDFTCRIRICLCESLPHPSQRGSPWGCREALLRGWAVVCWEDWSLKHTAHFQSHQNLTVWPGFLCESHFPVSEYQGGTNTPASPPAALQALPEALPPSHGPPQHPTSSTCQALGSEGLSGPCYLWPSHLSITASPGAQPSQMVQRRTQWSSINCRIMGSKCPGCSKPGVGMVS
jgi:hypothetical protein